MFMTDLHAPAMDLAFPADAHPRIRMLYDYWAGKRGGRDVPRRADLDPPLEIPALLPHVFLIDVISPVPQRLVYRVFGTALTDLFDCDFTGREVGSGTLPEHLAEMRARYARVIVERRPLYHRTRLRDRLNDHTEVDRIILPLTRDGTAVDQVIGLTTPLGAGARRL
jgi:hypothetical protein